jgi:hypothetical protein
MLFPGIGAQLGISVHHAVLPLSQVATHAVPET